MTQRGAYHIVFGIVFLSQAFATPGLAASVQAGATCTLKDAIRVFAKANRKGPSTRLARGATVAFVSHVGKETKVIHSKGKKGFGKKSWLSQICAWQSPPAPEPVPAPEPEPEPVPEPVPEQPAAAEQPTIEPLPQSTPKDTATDAAAVQASPASAVPESRRAIRIAVYSLDLENIPDGIGQLVTASLLAEVRKLENVSAVGMPEIRAMLSFEAKKQLVSCGNQASCLAQIVNALGADEIITGGLSEAADGRAIIVRRIDHRGQVANTVNRRLNIGNGEEFLLAIEPSVKDLFPKRSNRPGTSRGVPEKIFLRLNPRPIPTWITYSVAAAAGAAALLSGTAYALRGQAQDDINALAEQGNGVSQSNWDGPVSSWETWNQTFQVTGVAALGMVISAGVMTVFTDWEGYSDESP